ncbi:MAG: hypothetical protein HY865_13720 [Chloroflexi bacterium]|nr:hypothetical protein [Chloroflexota bacterium]
MHQKAHNFVPALISTACYVLVIIMIVGYVFIYQVEPFEGTLNDFILSVAFAFAAFLAAAVGTANYLHYKPDDSPRVVWLNLAIGFWLWCLSEAVWCVYYIRSGFEEVPTPSWADIGWLAGYIFFAIAVYHQYALIFPSQRNRIRNTVYGISAVVLILPLVGLLAMNAFTLENYINYFYSFADLAVGVAGLIFVFSFRGAMIARPWIGMVVFSVSDFLYAWALQAGIYAWALENGNMLTMVIDTTYLAAYLVLWLGFVSQWILINYGLRGNRN